MIKRTFDKREERKEENWNLRYDKKTKEWELQFKK